MTIFEIVLKTRKQWSVPSVNNNRRPCESTSPADSWCLLQNEGVSCQNDDHAGTCVHVSQMKKSGVAKRSLNNSNPYKSFLAVRLYTQAAVDCCVQLKHQAGSATPAECILS